MANPSDESETARKRPLAVLVEHGLPILTLFGLVVAWQIAVSVQKLPVWLLPSPAAVAHASVNWSQGLPWHLFVTCYETLAGFALACAIGVLTAALIVYSTVLQRTIYPILVALHSVPKVALAPLLLLWLGFGAAPKIVIVFLVSFFPIVVSAASGMQAVPAALIDLARSLSASPIYVFTKIRLPNSLPHLFVGLKVGVTLAVLGAVVGEFVGANMGLGYVIMVSAEQFNTALSFAAMLLLTLLSLGLYYAVDWIERLSIPWAAK